ncbi:MAG: hypothetical protein JSR58_05445 [Verrucomicrobia bacterium]|nr:hypothetical protein [Verrucomicrobiota bacterium]
MNSLISVKNSLFSGFVTTVSSGLEKLNSVVYTAMGLPQPESRSCSMWKCVKISSDKSGGTLSKFVFCYKISQLENKEISRWDIDKKIEATFPAIEFLETSPDLIMSFMHRDPMSIFEASSAEQRTVLKELGYSSSIEGDNICLTVPDAKMISYRWEQIRSAHQLPPISIISSDGIATDKEFTEVYEKHDGLLSDGKEMIHDHLVHISGILNEIIASKGNYPLYRPKMKKLILSLTVEPVQWAKENNLDYNYAELEALCGMQTDTYSVPTISEFLNPTMEIIEQIRHRSASIWNPYFQQRFKRNIEELFKKLDEVLIYYYGEKLGLKREDIATLIKEMLDYKPKYQALGDSPASILTTVALNLYGLANNVPGASKPYIVRVWQRTGKMPDLIEKWKDGLKL